MLFPWSENFDAYVTVDVYYWNRDAALYFLGTPIIGGDIITCLLMFLLWALAALNKRHFEDLVKPSPLYDLPFQDDLQNYGVDCVGE